MNERANNARATDTHSLKEHIKEYIPNWKPTDDDDQENKSRRGFNHPQYTRQLIPARYAKLFKEDPYRYDSQSLLLPAKPPCALNIT